MYHKKSIRVSDRATLFNFLIGVDGYTISSGVLSRELNDENIVALPLNVDEVMEIGWIQSIQTPLSSMGQEYLRYLKAHIVDYGFSITQK